MLLCVTIQASFARRTNSCRRGTNVFWAPGILTIFHHWTPAGSLRTAPFPAHHQVEQQIKDLRGKSERRGILIGVWDEREVPDELWSGYLGEDAP